MNPAAEYEARLARWKLEREAVEARFVTIGNARLAMFVAAALLAWAIFFRGIAPGWTLALPVAAFVALLVYHERVDRRRTFAARAIRYYETGLARLGESWAGMGLSGEDPLDSEHIYASDLDIFGRGSLFERIAAVRTAAGEHALANWLLAPATRDDALERQAAVAELRDKLELRQDLALLGEEIKASVHAAALEQWGAAPPVPFSATLRWTALILALAGVAAFVAFMAQALPLSPFLCILAADFAFILVLRQRVAAVVQATDIPGHDLRILGFVLERLEREQFEAPLLRRLRSRLDTNGGRPASRRIARLERWVELLDSADHVFVRVIRPVVLWMEQVAMGIEAWRRENGDRVGAWLAAVGELEALSSFAGFAFERPEYVFPELVESGGPLFQAEALQHPLISPARAIANDVELGGARQLLIVSGSNMSGKSTLLRAVGLNTALAWAGSPVAARRLRVSRLQTGASIRVVDSLQDGKSRFYAEITRIRRIVDLAGAGTPVLFLLDEVLSGTNSHDRRIGAAAIVRGLVERGAIGFITTHDLALADLERDLGAAAANVHFEDHIEDGRIEFDYRLRPGVVTRSNAIELMRAVGLPV
jgi:hypothetical protein